MAELVSMSEEEPLFMEELMEPNMLGNIVRKIEFNVVGVMTND